MKAYWTLAIICTSWLLVSPTTNNLKPKKRNFRKHKYQIVTDSGVYQFLYASGIPRRKSPFKGWVFVNPIEEYSTDEVKLQLALTKKPPCYFRKTSIDTYTTIIFPYYEKRTAISYGEYKQFWLYVRDSCIRQDLSHWFPEYIKPNQNLNWETKLHLPTAHKLEQFSLYAYYPEWLGQLPWIDRNKATYTKWQHPSANLLAPWPKYSCNRLRVSTRVGTPLIRVIDNYIYPDTFLWANKKNSLKDSILANVLACQWLSNFQRKDMSNAPLALDSNKAACYADWMAHQSFYSAFFDIDTEPFGWNSGVIKLDTPVYQFEFSDQDLSHYRITNKEYQTFLLYVRDSIIKWELGGNHVNAIGSRIVWETPIDFDTSSTTFGYLSKLIDTSKNPIGFKNRYLRYYYESTSQIHANAEFEKEKIRRNSPRSSMTRNETFILPRGPFWEKQISFKHYKLLKALKNNKLVEGLTYEQAQAFWHWRTHVQQKGEILPIAQYLIPTKEEWHQLQSTGQIQPKKVTLKGYAPAYSVRVYLF